MLQIFSGPSRQLSTYQIDDRLFHRTQLFLDAMLQAREPSLRECNKINQSFSCVKFTSDKLEFVNMPADA